MKVLFRNLPRVDEDNYKKPLTNVIREWIRMSGFDIILEDQKRRKDSEELPRNVPDSSIDTDRYHPYTEYIPEQRRTPEIVPIVRYPVDSQGVSFVFFGRRTISP